MIRTLDPTSAVAARRSPAARRSALLAQSAAPALRASVTVTGDIVRIGDLIENAGAGRRCADLPLARSRHPRRGRRPTASSRRSAPHQLIGIDTRGLTEVVVTRASRTITAQEISARIAQALAGQYGFGEARNILVTFDRDVRTLQVEPNATGELQVVALAYDPRTRVSTSPSTCRRARHCAGSRRATPAPRVRDGRCGHGRSSDRARRSDQGLRPHHRCDGRRRRPRPSPTSNAVVGHCRAASAAHRTSR